MYKHNGSNLQWYCIHALVRYPQKGIELVFESKQFHPLESLHAERARNSSMVCQEDPYLGKVASKHELRDSKKNPKAATLFLFENVLHI